MGWPPEKVHKGGLRNAVQSLSVAASPNILFVDISESGDPLNDINGLAEVCEPGTVVIAAGQVNDVRLYRDLISSGLQDYLLKPFGADQLREVFTQAQAVFNAPKILDPSAERPHLTTAVIGRSEEHTYELQSLMRISYADSCLKKNKQKYYN